MTHCSFTQQAWLQLTKALKLNFRWTRGTLQSWFLDWSINSASFPHLPTIFCWNVWLERNRVIFDTGRPSLNLISHKSSSGLTFTPPTNALWGITSRVFDRAAHVQGLKNGAGGVIRIDEHTKYKWSLNCRPGTNNRAELLGVWALLTIATQLHLQDLQVFEVSRIVIDWLNPRGNLHILNLHCWKERVKDLVEGFRTLCFTHVFREFNQQADTLSKSALNFHEGRINCNQMVDGHLGLTMALKLWERYIFSVDQPTCTVTLWSQLSSLCLATDILHILFWSWLEVFCGLLGILVIFLVLVSTFFIPSREVERRSYISMKCATYKFSKCKLCILI